ncbi:hypothetical protein LTR86_009581 [Recurvomyces mirabilis]|nr:hypothetical protein LTR86_009581 [Recurvomyces mirabilis]
MNARSLAWRPLNSAISQGEALERLLAPSARKHGFNDTLNRIRQAMRMPHASGSLLIKIFNDLDTVIFHNKLRRRIFLSWRHLTQEDPELICNPCAVLWGQTNPANFRGQPRIAIELNTQAPWHATTRKDSVGVLVHEMLHAWFMVHCGIPDDVVVAKGMDVHHGYYFHSARVYIEQNFGLVLLEPVAISIAKLEISATDNPPELREAIAAHGLAGNPRPSTTMSDSQSSAITFLRQERMARIEADLRILSTDQMIRKYNPSGYEGIKTNGGIMEPGITKAQKRRRDNTAYDEPIKPNPMTPADLWGVRLPYFTQSEFAKVNAVLDTYKKPRRKPRREAREVGDSEIAGVVDRKGVVRQARRAARGEEAIRGGDVVAGAVMDGRVGKTRMKGRRVPAG